MQFLADESCDFAVVRALRDAGHGVLAVAEVTSRAEDDAVLELARKQQRILLTEDKDFGRLVYGDEQATGGDILARYPANVRAHLPSDMLTLVNKVGDDLVGRFVVVQPGHIRLGAKRDAF